MGVDSNRHEGRLEKESNANDGESNQMVVEVEENEYMLPTSVFCV